MLPEATLQDHLFEPCGYSMNALEGKSYYTIHVSYHAWGVGDPGIVANLQEQLYDEIPLPACAWVFLVFAWRSKRGMRNDKNYQVDDAVAHAEHAPAHHRLFGQ